MITAWSHASWMLLPIHLRTLFTPQSILYIVFYYRLLLMSDLSKFLVVPSRSKAHMTRIEKKGGGSESGRVRIWSPHLVGRGGCLLWRKENLFFLKMTAHFSLFLCLSASTSTLPRLTLMKVKFVQRRGHSLSKGYWPGCTGGAPPHHLWVNMSGHSKCSREIILSFLSLLNTHTWMRSFTKIHTSSGM